MFERMSMADTFKVAIRYILYFFFDEGENARKTAEIFFMILIL